MVKSKQGFWAEIRESVPAYLLILPTLIVFCVFLYTPFVNALRISTYKYNGIGDLNEYVGFGNYAAVLQDPKFYSAFWNTFQLIGADAVLSIGIGFLLAYVLYRGIPLKRFFSTALFIPYLISMVVIGSIWRIIYDPSIGPLNQLLELIGLGDWAQPWLSNEHTALPAIMMTWIWHTIPFNMLIMYANVMTMPNDFLEAAEMDGATSMQKLRYVIIPYLMPTFATLLLLTVTNDLRAFDMVWVMTQGGPGGASEVITSYVYRKAFSTQNFGTATAASIIMMIVMVAIMIFSQLLRRKEGAQK
ncbi:L-arabinose transport system permease protein AraP [Paenibacillus konkukensis]|uniref:L-arabinose transport system permease protein AraP n=1 Tax=Paenibacillus konkukensis TaxID=2020716 RepID=A0ABY4RJ19_9BACL|nr:sugar ABC transporter permease [Paenibacillus konkukensis]UQZ82422.1 L-arabinose transport system permease protein AraP [Paenibacillus konkukensis]